MLEQRQLRLPFLSVWVRQANSALSMAAWLAAAVPIAWLLPNHYFPWTSAWQDGLAITLLAACALLCRQLLHLPRCWFPALAVALASVAWQWLHGQIAFSGDALMAALYLLSFGLALALGAALATPADAPTTDAFLTATSVGVLAGAVLSTAIAFVQWTGAVSLGIWGADLPPGGRPFANVAQPNNFCTIAFLGVCAAVLLHQQRRIGKPVLLGTAVWLMCGMAMSGSRTGWLQMAAFVAVCAAYGRRMTLALSPRLALGLALQFALLALAWPWLAELAGIGGARSAAEQAKPGTRLAHWQALIDAVGREPWSGWGWQQVGAAQQAVALDHPPVGEYIEHSHNIVLDLLVWAGLPVGGLIVMLMIAALWRAFVGLRDPRAVWLLAGVAGLLVHANLELPLEYAYFLAPMGLALGAAHALGRVEPEAAPKRRLRIPTLPLAGLLLGGLLTVVAIDYLKAEENMRALRLETARIGVSKIETPAAELRVLDQLQAFQEFARTEAKPDMTPDEVERMRRVSERFAYPPSMFRYALAAGLNGEPEQAARTLARLCRIHPPERCDEGREAWTGLQQRYPALLEVQWP